jgi:hypothetical protein
MRFEMRRHWKKVTSHKETTANGFLGVLKGANSPTRDPEKKINCRKGTHRARSLKIPAPGKAWQVTKAVYEAGPNLWQLYHGYVDFFPLNKS